MYRGAFRFMSLASRAFHNHPRFWIDRDFLDAGMTSQQLRVGVVCIVLIFVPNAAEQKIHVGVPRSAFKRRISLHAGRQRATV
jgi:hypothetical protein